MNEVLIPIPVASIGRQRKRSQPKGRQVDAAALAEVRAVLADMPRRRDLLIEHLHAINDRYGQLALPHLAALAAELGMSQAEVYEVATFYHHFDVVRGDAEGNVAPPPTVTVRVCEGIACELAGARDLLARLPALLDADVRVVAAPCIGRCERAPAALVGQNPVDHADADTVAQRVTARAWRHEPEPWIDLKAYREHGGYTLLRALADGKLEVEQAIVAMEQGTLQPHGCFIGSAAVVVLSHHDRAVDVARNLMHFFRHESCGQCTPCRVGTAKAAALIAAPRWDLDALADLSAVMRDASICGLGQAAPNPIDCVVKYFPHELE